MARDIWERGTVILLIQEFNERYGRPPAASDWNPSLARRIGCIDRAERFKEDGCWPSTNTVRHLFGSWNKGIEAAGFKPRPTGRAA